MAEKDITEKTKQLRSILYQTWVKTPPLDMKCFAALFYRKPVKKYYAEIFI